MKVINFLTAIIFLLVITGCHNQNTKISKQDCINKNKKYKIEKQLNYRTGKYVERVVCL